MFLAFQPLQEEKTLEKECNACHKSIGMLTLPLICPSDSHIIELPVVPDIF